MLRLYLWPFFSGEDKGDGGVRRVVEAQQLYLPGQDIEIVNKPDQADVFAFHIQSDQAVLKRFPNVPLVAHCHGLYWQEYEWENWSREVNKRVLDLIVQADVVTAPSEWVSQVIRRHTNRRVYTVYHGVDFDDFLPGKNQGYVLWNKTRIDPVCDTTPLNDLAKLLPSIRFVSTYGEPNDNIAITGKVPYQEAKEYVCNAGVYLATTRETFGIGTLEAMAAGVPIVGYAWGGQPEIVTHKVDGWLARPGDVSGLAEGVEWALEHREQVGRAARETANTFKWERAAEQYADIYREVAERATHTSRLRRSSRSASGSDEAVDRRQPRVSVIVTAYNLEGYLDAALRSVAESTLEDFECIVVDDASPDRCGEIADTWAKRDQRFRVIHNAENQYLAGARNTGIGSARGKYILPLDADDRLSPVALELLAGALDADRAIHIAYGNVFFVNEQNEPEQYGRDPGHSGWPIDYNYEWHVHLKRNILPYCSMFRRDVWELTGGYRSRYRTGEDADFWIRAASYGFTPKMVTKEDTLLYTNRAGSMSRTNQHAGWEDWYPWVRRPELNLAAAPNGERKPPVSTFEPIIISVVIPVGPNHAKYVIDAVDSVDAQTFRNWECLVVNDTGEELPPLPAWVKIVENSTGVHSAARARNLGVAMARGMLYLPLDADDYLQPGALEVLFDAYQQNPGNVIYGDFLQDPDDEGVFTPYRTPDPDPNLLVKKGCLHPVTALTPRAVWETVGGYDEELPSWEDWAFQLSCAAIGVCSTRIPYVLFTYRKHTGYRREENYENFGRGKEGILKKFGKYWEGEELMACRSCGGRPSNSMPVSAQPQFQRPPENFVLLQDTGEGAGGVNYRAPASGTNYRFAGGEEKYVMPQDVEHFLRLGHFTVVQEPIIGEEPILVTAAVSAPASQPVVEVASLEEQTIPEIRPAARRGRPANNSGVSNVANE